MEGRGDYVLTDLRFLTGYDVHTQEEQNCNRQLQHFMNAFPYKIHHTNITPSHPAAPP